MHLPAVGYPHKPTEGCLNKARGPCGYLNLTMGLQALPLSKY